MAEADRTLLAALATTDALAQLLIEKGVIAGAEDVLNLWPLTRPGLLTSKAVMHQSGI
jgi:hypothetical protein